MGVAISMTLLINVASPHMIEVVKSWVKACKIGFCANCCATTEESLRNIYDPADFELAPRCGALLNTTFCTLFYCAGCPVLVVFAFFNFLLVFSFRDRRTFVFHGAARNAAWFSLIAAAV